MTTISQSFDLTCTMEVRVRLTQIEQFYESLKNTQICRKT